MAHKKFRTDNKWIDETNQAIPTYYYELTIASGQTVSDSFDMKGDAVVGIRTPSGTFEPTEVTFEVDHASAGYIDLDGVAITTEANKAYNIDPGSVYGWMKARLSVNSAPAADRTVVVILKKV